ncbi:MAG: D-alanyl-D-alanine carboxypeptidase family protein [Bacillota bacterium]|nr:D-alanyl-D-alanine carboxypeptidase family protein [Bacillota bacterium]
MRIFKCVCMMFLAMVGLMLCPQSLQAELPPMHSQYYCLVDQDTGQTILAKNADVKRPVASTTKMMTAILAVEYCGLDEIAVVSENADHTPEYTIGLREGQEISMSELLKVALVRSSNDAAVVIAEYIAGDEAFFASLMSTKAFSLGAVNTRFKNASGLPNNDHYSTAGDLAQIGIYALRKPYIKEMVGRTEVGFQHPGYREPMIINNTNSLLRSYPGANGIKTGTANASGKCLVASATRNGSNLIAVSLRSANRNADCVRLFDYGFKNTSLQRVVEMGTVFKSIKLENGKQSFVDVGPSEDIIIRTGNDRPDLQKMVNIQYALKAPIKQGDKVGKMHFFVGGRYHQTIDLVCLYSVEQEPGLVKKGFKKIIKGKF